MDPLREELEHAYQSFGDQFYRTALAVTRCRATAQDAVQTAFAKALRISHQPRDIKAYMFRSIRNAAIDLRRKQRRTVPLTADMIFETPPEQQAHVELVERLEKIARCLEKLSEDERETIIQHLAADLSFQEIADQRQRPLPTITSWYRRGMAKLKKKMNHG